MVGRPWHGTCNIRRRVELERKGPSMTSRRASHAITLFFILASTLSTAVLALALVVANTSTIP